VESSTAQSVCRCAVKSVVRTIYLLQQKGAMDVPRHLKKRITFCNV